MKIERLERVDFYKSILMFGVVWGHLCTVLLTGLNHEITLHTLIRTYDMPFFMIISGFFLSKSCDFHKMNQLVVDKCTSILLPSLIWSLFFSQFRSISVYYFLLAIFYSSIIMILLKKAVKNKITEIFFVTIFIFLLHCVNLDLCNLPYLFPFFAIGFYMNSIRDGHILEFVAFVIMFCFWDPKYTIWSTGSYILDKNSIFYLICLFRFFIGFVGIFSVKLLMDMLYDYLIAHSSYNFIFRHMVDWGKYTLAIYILQNFFVFQLLKRGMLFVVYSSYKSFFLSNVKFTAYVLAPFLSIMIMLISVVILKFCSNNRYLRYLWGFKIKM